MPTFSIYELPYLRRHQDRVRAARQAAATDPTPINPALVLVDARTLRGIPAVGRGVSGAIHGTNPPLEIERRWIASNQ